MRFHLEVDAHLEANDIEDALFQLSIHFRGAFEECAGIDEDFEGCFTPPSEIHLRPDGT